MRLFIRTGHLLGIERGLSSGRDYAFYWTASEEYVDHNRRVDKKQSLLRRRRIEREREILKTGKSSIEVTWSLTSVF